uniref:Uncharacterized protein n=1 Tax=Plectus sambesii TaxID=2011161 RepID=A0A914V4W9_9BILA
MDPVDIPESLSAAPQQLVALVGLDTNNNPTHRNVADSFCVNRRPDRLPLHFRLIAADHEFPRAKPK